MDRPNYPYKPIGSIESLASCLGVTPHRLMVIAENADSSYTEFTKNVNGKNRNLCDPKNLLKSIQKRINSRIFEKVYYPDYLQGGLRDVDNPRDYVRNSFMHAGSKHLISLDIKNFYENIRYDKVKEIFLYFFNFPDEVSEVLSKLVTLRGKIPQGACTSSYIANLVFHDEEYHLVSFLKSKGVVYSRLLDDVAISSKRELADAEVSEIISRVSALFRAKGLRQNPSKKKIELSKDSRSDYRVTGVWVGHGEAKLRRKDRDYVRQLVYCAEKEYLRSSESDRYHELWNRASAKVAQMSRFNHHQSKNLRFRLSKILPTYSPSREKQLSLEFNKIISRNPSFAQKISFVKTVNRYFYCLNILARTNSSVAKGRRDAIRKKFPNLISEKDYWEK